MEERSERERHISQSSRRTGEMGGAALFLCSDDGSYTGETVTVAGGMKSSLYLPFVVLKFLFLVALCDLYGGGDFFLF